jgi:geranylgeranyl pyrophosphate synthase
VWAPPLGRFGADVGLAFQIFDDVLDVAGPMQRTGKPRGADLMDGTVTLPLILARELDGELKRLDVRSAVTGPAEAADVCDRIAQTGALEEAREQAAGYVIEAKAALGEVELPEARRQVLELVADGVVERFA